MKTARSPSIVVIENQPIMLNALKTVFSAEGMRVLATVSHGGDAIEIVKQNRPHIVLFSVNTNDADDFQAIATLRSEAPSTFILALVSGESPLDEKLALEYGAHLVLTKSMRRDDLLAIVKTLSRLQFCEIAT
jgi:DNA-binding NarL/FixJ family response regulator